eukprot:m.660908 g.660908  ORF g.660908 m.660908 type:complete len:82 (-) comp22732_c1_seq2:108-353(-)
MLCIKPLVIRTGIHLGTVTLPHRSANVASLATQQHQGIDVATSVLYHGHGIVYESYNKTAQTLSKLQVTSPSSDGVAQNVC